ncbi:MAG: hypothetical protein L0215_00810 [Gemmataceae bacterium]|nr:hypothetical protein [Gemmataceae bacterium]
MFALRALAVGGLLFTGLAAHAQEPDPFSLLREPFRSIFENTWARELTRDQLTQPGLGRTVSGWTHEGIHGKDLAGRIHDLQTLRKGLKNGDYTLPFDPNAPLSGRLPGGGRFDDGPRVLPNSPQSLPQFGGQGKGKGGGFLPPFGKGGGKGGGFGKGKGKGR